MQGTLATTQRSLSSGSHRIANMELALQDMRVVLLAGVSDNRSGKAGSCNSQDFG